MCLFLIIGASNIGYVYTNSDNLDDYDDCKMSIEKSEEKEPRSSDVEHAAQTGMTPLKDIVIKID